jgi:hypothetical protein
MRLLALADERLLENDLVHNDVNISTGWRRRRRRRRRRREGGGALIGLGC